MKQSTTTTEILEALEILKRQAQRTVCAGGVIERPEAERMAEFEAEVVRRGDERRLLGLRDEYGVPIYDAADVDEIVRIQPRPGLSSRDCDLCRSPLSHEEADRGSLCDSCED